MRLALDLAGRGFAGAGDPRNALEVGGDFDIVPLRLSGMKRLEVFEQATDTFDDRTADLHYQPAAGLERGMRGGDECFYDLKAGSSGEDGVARLELADLELDLICFGLADVGRVGDD